jgi:hypothetical protein
LSVRAGWELRNTLAMLSAAYIASQAFDSVIRWVLNMVHAAAAIYLRDADLIIMAFLCCYLIARDGRSVIRTMLMFSITAVTVCVGLYSELNVAQMLFGLKVWLPLLVGFLLVEAGVLAVMDWRRIWWLVWFALCCGVLLNHFVEYPWSGLNVDVGDTSITANREWASGGIRRLSGFSRSSFDAAAAILLLYIYLICSYRGVAARLLLIVLSAAAIALTTSKGVVAAFFATLCVLPWILYAKTPGGVAKFALSGAVLAVAAIGMVAPLMSEGIQFPRLQVGTVEFWLFASFVDRAWVTWPQSFSLLREGWQWLTGRGVGGIGAAQFQFEPSIYTPGDNFFVYIYVTAGVVGAAFYIYFALSVLKLSLDQLSHRMASLVMLAVFAYGMTVNLIESATFALSLGAVFAFTLTCHHVERSNAKSSPAGLPVSVGP